MKRLLEWLAVAGLALVGLVLLCLYLPFMALGWAYRKATGRKRDDMEDLL
jgi:hypothetical protein